MDSHHPQPASRHRVANTDCFALQVDLAFVWLQHAADKIDERALAGSILTDQCVDFASLQFKVDTIQRKHTRK